MSILRPMGSLRRPSQLADRGLERHQPIHQRRPHRDLARRGASVEFGEDEVLRKT